MTEATKNVLRRWVVPSYIWRALSQPFPRWVGIIFATLGIAGILLAEAAVSPCQQERLSAECAREMAKRHQVCLDNAVCVVRFWEVARAGIEAAQRECEGRRLTVRCVERAEAVR